jgi:hypothetical protein
MINVYIFKKLLLFYIKWIMVDDNECYIKGFEKMCIKIFLL